MSKALFTITRKGEAPMPFSGYPATAPFTPATRAEDLLTSRELFSDHWFVEFGKAKVFYVRGSTDFKGRVLHEVSRIYEYKQTMKTLLNLMQGWGDSYFNWQEPFSKIQLSDGLNKHLLSFDKAAQVILLCATAAQERHGEDAARPTGAEIYGKMRIDPAVYFIHGLDKVKLDEIRQRDSGFLTQLRLRTGQKTTQVFTDMAERKRVTLRLARLVHAELRLSFPDMDLGDIDILDGRKLSVSTNEYVDLK
jgi:hypothetical protein